MKKLSISDILHQNQLDGIEALADSLETLDVSKFEDHDLARLKDFSKLENTDGIADPTDSSKYLELSYCRKLADLRGIDTLRNRQLLCVVCRLELTLSGYKLSLRVDPCDHTSLTDFVGEIWSDRHGIFKCHSPLGITG